MLARGLFWREEEEAQLSGLMHLDVFFAVQRDAAYVIGQVHAFEFPQTGTKSDKGLPTFGSPRTRLTTRPHPKPLPTVSPKRGVVLKGITFFR